MNYDKIAEDISKEIINYKVRDESFIEVYEICLNKHGKFSSRESNKILTRVIHFVTIMGYDIDNINPCRFRSFLD